MREVRVGGVALALLSSPVVVQALDFFGVRCDLLPGLGSRGLRWALGAPALAAGQRHGEALGPPGRCRGRRSLGGAGERGAASGRDVGVVAVLRGALLVLLRGLQVKGSALATLLRDALGGVVLRESRSKLQRRAPRFLSSPCQPQEHWS